MNTTVYLIRHSEKLTIKNQKTYDSFQMQNEKIVLTVKGELKAKKMSGIEEFKNIDIVISSNYSRAVATAKYIAYNNNIETYVNSNFGERKVGINSYEEIPDNYELNQYKDENYKYKTGESRKEAYERLIKEFTDILNNNKGKRIVIVFHATAITFLLQKWCQVDFDGNTYSIKFNEKRIFDSLFDSPEIFKLEFDENSDLMNITNIKY